MSDWKEYKLGEICVFNYGKALKTTDRKAGEVPVYSSAGITGYHNEASILSSGIIIGRKGTIGKVYFSATPFCCIDTAYYILPDERYNLKYLYYGLKMLGLEELNEDSAVPGLNRETAYKQTISLPPLLEQERIAGILSSLDDKIDLLNRQNTTLEALAETLFKQWFIENPKPEWKETKLGDIINIESGKGITKDIVDNNGFFPILGANGEIGRSNSYLYRERLIFTGRVGTLGNVFRIEDEKVWLTDNTLIIRNIKWFNFIYFLLKLAKLEELNVGSTQPLIRQSDLKELNVVLPNNELLCYFEMVSDILFAKINSNKTQILTLNELRCNILSKLMNNKSTHYE